MSAALAHRGPDDEGEYADPQGRMSLGARRLSIIDVEGGHQPVGNEDGTVWAVHNGEIYNHAALIDRLTRNGHRFSSRCDTEVLVHLYEELGPDLLHALEGMFAFAIWDEVRGRLLLARDRFGEKPLFVHESGGEIAFASELTALRQAVPGGTIRRDSVDTFFVFGYLPGPETMFEGISQLPPGHLLDWDTASTRAELRRYWRPPRRSATSKEADRDLQAETTRLLERSVRQATVSDVPLGVFISGGVDSAVVAALAAKVSATPPKTFTVGYDVGDVSELENARQTAKVLGTDHHELVLTAGDVRTRVPRLLASLDQPLADQALVPLHAISAEARRTVKVAIGGQGADELFGGYPRYRWIQRSRMLQDGPTGSLRRRATRRFVGPSISWGRREQLATVLAPSAPLDRHLQWVTKGRFNARGLLYGDRLSDLRASDFPVLTCQRHLSAPYTAIGTAELMELDRAHWLPDDILMMSDRAGMLVGLEIRTPFLSRELAEFAPTVALGSLLGRSGKALLRGMLGDLLPAASARRRKVAFRAPGAEWLRGPLRDDLIQHLTEGPLVMDAWVNPAVARAWLDEHLSGTRDFANILWPLLALGSWLEAQK